MLRRMKADMDEIKLPPKEELLVYVPLTPLQRFWYKRLITRLDSSTLLNEVLGNSALEETKSETSSVVILNTPPKKRSQLKKEKDIPAELRPRISANESNAWQKLMNLLMQLRKACNHPYLFRGAEPEPYILGEHLVEGSGKFLLLDKLMPKLFKEGHRVLLFSGFVGMLDICEDYFLYRGWKYARLDGQTTRPRRALDIRLFNQKNSRTPLPSTHTDISLSMLFD